MYYWIVKAYCPETGMTVKNQDLTNSHLQIESIALEEAQQLCAKMKGRTGLDWEPRVEWVKVSEKLA